VFRNFDKHETAVSQDREPQSEVIVRADIDRLGNAHQNDEWIRVNIDEFQYNMISEGSWVFMLVSVM
jgi:hypothetical protein